MAATDRSHDDEFSAWWQRKGQLQLRAALLAWDPIGVTSNRADWPYVFDEYDSYLEPLVTLLRDGAQSDDVAVFLDGIVERFGGRPGHTPDAARSITTWFATMAPHRRDQKSNAPSAADEPDTPTLTDREDDSPDRDPPPARHNGRRADRLR